MESMKKAGFHQILRAFILGGFAAYIVYLVRNDALVYYIAPRMQLYVKLSAMALYVIAAYQLYSGVRALSGQQDRSCGCEHDKTLPSSPVKTTVFYSLFVGKTAEISGFVYRDDSMKRNQFAVTRFEVQCCSADASAFGIMVELDEAPKYKTDDWMKVTGVIGKSKYEDNDIVKLDATKIEPIQAPGLPSVIFASGYKAAARRLRSASPICRDPRQGAGETYDDKIVANTTWRKRRHSSARSDSIGCFGT